MKLSKINKLLPQGNRLAAAYGSKLYGQSNKKLKIKSPVNNHLLGQIALAKASDYEKVVKEAQSEFLKWRALPAPKRALIIQEISAELKKIKNDLGTLISLETGKLLGEGCGEVQEAIDIADYAVGLSRQLGGLPLQSERAEHRMFEQWHPLGVVGVISAFNYPCAVWAWNAMIGALCGNVIIWKPSEIAPLSSLATNEVCRNVAVKHGFPALFSLVNGNADIGKKLAADPRVALVSATGSSRMGKSIAETVAKRFGKSILELGGNNAVIVMDDADIKLALQSVVFGAVGTAGQRCTTTRRLFLHKNIAANFIENLVSVYSQIKIGDPLKTGNLVGPLINRKAVQNFQQAIKEAKLQGGELLIGGESCKNMPSELYVRPAIIKAKPDMKVIQTETFGPLLYVCEFSELEEAIKYNNSVPQGLSSAIFTKSIRNAEIFTSAIGSDCGIANVNTGTSQAEIGGAFGGEKETGGGRESGSDSWKQYMRRVTSTVNYSTVLPLAQGLKFEISV